ncbi:hypothetical protein Tco_0760550 [Tanacetum coccineum]
MPTPQTPYASGNAFGVYAFEGLRSGVLPLCRAVTLKRLSLNSVSKADDLQARNASSFTFSLLLQTLKVYIEEEDTIGVCGVDCGILPHLWLLQDPTIKAKKLLELP